MSEPDFSKPCGECAEGKHNVCSDGLCGCIADHSDDVPMMRGFKRLKRTMHPERESWVVGGWR